MMRVLAGFTVAFLILPLAALLMRAPVPSLTPALWISLGTSAVAMVFTVGLGVPLAWVLSRHSARWTLPLQLPVVLPPTVLGLALLEAFGRQGVVPLGWSFRIEGVVLVQVFVALPLFVLVATEVFRRISPDLLFVAQTLGATPRQAWLRVALPASVPGLAGALGLAWARALGEFGATLMFAGSLEGSTQTLPVAIYAALEVDLDLARSLALLLVAVAVAGLLLLHLLERR